MTAADGCGAHAGIAEDLKALLRTALDRIDPVLDRLREEQAAGGGDAAEPPAAPDPCASCPICAVIAALRGERPELAVRLAEHAAGLVAVLRTALDDGVPAPAPPPDVDEDADRDGRPPARRVQRIPVQRRTP
ncbi:hypothetical protein [Pseudonocardia adelaidensis]|uniref:Uncharacterized protein n=1 Tax=Pseudonocardia adelaidensis TaxID=648754 RepID=A0ABP9NGR5_9PSEU